MNIRVFYHYYTIFCTFIVSIKSLKEKKVSEFLFIECHSKVEIEFFVVERNCSNNYLHEYVRPNVLIEYIKRLIHTNARKLEAIALNSVAFIACNYYGIVV